MSRVRSPSLVRAYKASFAIFVVVFAYGMYRFPDGPLREVDGKYFGKRGVPHTREEYVQYRVWTVALFGTFAPSVVTGILVSRKR